MQNEHTLARSVERRHLLLDSRIVEGTDNAELVVGSVEKHETNPLFGEDKPWEMRFDNLYANVLFDDEEQIYKVWYSPFIVDHSAKGMSAQQWKETKYQAPFDREMALCYASSKDGITWTKPELGLVDYDGNKANNILWRGSGNTRAKKAGPHGSGVFKDLDDPDPKRRYKALLKSEILSVAFSSDGIHWQAATACPEANSAGDTHNNAFWAPTLDKYVGITRQWSKSFDRQVARTTSEDFLSWEKTHVVLEGLDSRHQTYAMPTFFHGGVYIGLLAIHDQVSDRVWSELTWSPDTETWHRVCPGTPFIPNSENEGEYDWGCAYAAAHPILDKEEIRIYYGGSDGLHTSWRNGYFCLATLRQDGFAGYKVLDSGRPATVTTVPVFNARDSLSVSADIRDGGELIVRVLDDEQQVVAESEYLSGTVTDEEIHWLRDCLVSSEKDQRMQIQLVFRDATVYSFTIGAKED